MLNVDLITLKKSLVGGGNTFNAVMVEGISNLKSGRKMSIWGSVQFCMSFFGPLSTVPSITPTTFVSVSRIFCVEYKMRAFQLILLSYRSKELSKIKQHSVVSAEGGHKID